MLFSTKRCNFRDTPQNIAHPDNDTVVDKTDQYKYLGIWLDPHLALNTHMNKISSKVMARTRLLWRILSFISQTLRTNYLRASETRFILVT